MFKVCVSGKQFLRRDYRTRSDAKKAEAKFMITDNKHIVDPLLSEVASSYLSIHGEMLKYSTLNRLEGKIRNYVLGRLRDKPISRYSFLDLNIWWDGIKKSKLKDKNDILGVLKAVFHHAQIYFDFQGHEHEKLVPYRDFPTSLLNHLQKRSI